MIVDVHTHFFRPELDFGPALRADMARCGVSPAAWGDVGERHLETTCEADIAVVFGLSALAQGIGSFLIIAGLPGSAEWAIGLLVGINLVLGGASLVGMALAARNA